MEGKVIIFSAPSGAGKTTVVRHLLKSRNDLAFSVSATTRAPRGQEEDGKDYYFLSLEGFREKVNNAEFVEWEEVYEGLCYGTLKAEVARIWAAGKTVLFDVDVKGGMHLKEIYGHKALDIFIEPPSLAVLENRLRNRGTETEQKIKERVRKAELELKFRDNFSVVIVNNDLETTLEATDLVVKAFLEA